MIYSADYPNANSYISALNKEFIAVGDMHVVKAEYQLDRKCQIEDTFTILQQYQQATDTVLFENSFEGFESYVPPVGYRVISYEHSSYTTIQNPILIAAMGSTLELTVINSGNYAIANLEVNLKVFSNGIELSSFDETANSQNQAVFMVPIPVGIGPILIKTSFTSVPSNQVFLLYAGEQLPTTSPILSINPLPIDIIQINNTGIVVGDYNDNGTINVNDFLIANQRYPANRLDARNFISASLSQDYYYPGLQGGSLTVSIKPVSKPLNRLRYAVYLHDADQTPVGQKVVKESVSDSFITFSNLDAGYVGNLYANITVYNAYNTLTVGANLPGYAITINNSNIEPGNIRQLTFTPAGTDYFVAGSTFYIYLPWNTEPTLVTVPNTGAFNYSITVPTTYDSSGAVQFSWVNPIWANRLYLVVQDTAPPLTFVSLSKYSYLYNQADSFQVIINNTLGPTYNFTIKLYNGAVNPANEISSNSILVQGGATLNFTRNILPAYTNSVTVVVS